MSGLTLGLNGLKLTSGSGGSVMINGLRIALVPAATWIGIRSMAIVLSDGSNVMPTTRVTYAGSNDFDSITAGEYTSTTTFNQVSLQPWSFTSPTWNGSGNNMDVYMEFSSPIAQSDLATFQMCLQNTATYDLPTFTIFDENANEISIASGPADKNDFNGDETIDTVTTTNTERFKWTF